MDSNRAVALHHTPEECTVVIVHPHHPSEEVHFPAGRGQRLEPFGGSLGHPVTRANDNAPVRCLSGPQATVLDAGLRRGERIVVDEGRVSGVVANGKLIRCGVVVSNSNLKTTIEKLVGPEHFPDEFVEESEAVRLNNSSCQVYLGIRQGETLPYIGDLLFTSVDPEFDSVRLCAKDVTSRTFSMYYPEIRPGSDRYAEVPSTNANWDDWAHLSDEEYSRGKRHLIETTLGAFEKYVPDIRVKVDHVEAATPRTFQQYTLHVNGATFGTKFEGLKVSMDLPKVLPGLFHTGSVGIIMSGWLGAINYGVIVANEVESFILGQESEIESAAS